MQQQVKGKEREREPELDTGGEKDTAQEGECTVSERHWVKISATDPNRYLIVPKRSHGKQYYPIDNTFSSEPPSIHLCIWPYIHPSVQPFFYQLNLPSIHPLAHLTCETLWFERPAAVAEVRTDEQTDRLIDGRKNLRTDGSKNAWKESWTDLWTDRRPKWQRDRWTDGHTDEGQGDEKTEGQ